MHDRPTSTESGALRRYLESLTLLSLWLAVSLYFLGQIQSWKYLQAFEVPSTGVDHAWETFVFLGAVTLLNEVPNLLLHPDAQVAAWALPLLLFAFSAWAWRRLPAEGEWTRRLLRGALLAGSALAYLTFLVTLGAVWGSRAARIFKQSPRAPERFLLAPEAQQHYPAGFLEANGRGELRQLATGADALFIYEPARDTTYAVPNRLLLGRVYEPARSAR
ncbi:MAG TPA: hypothetical protein VJ570_14225 [Holophagaceae bacterium]|nr:hypothetical protein [Holophagaceae bacterium]